MRREGIRRFHGSVQPGMPRPGVVRVVEVELARIDVTDAAQVLDAGERARAEAFLRPSDRDRYVASHIAFREIVAACLAAAPAEVEFARDCLHCGDPGHGKPRVAAPAAPGTAGALDVNLSHAGELAVVAVAVAPLRVGVDVERERPDLDWSEILGASCPDARTGLRRWTRAEAVLKAAGLGLVARPDVGDVANREGWYPASVPGTAEPWFVRDIPLRAGENYALAVSVDAEDIEVQVTTWPEIASSGQGSDNVGRRRAAAGGRDRDIWRGGAAPAVG
jgi:4'-phosphopantetheinyl transferase